MKVGQNQNQKANAKKRNLLSPFYIHHPPYKRPDKDGHKTMNTHDQSNPSLGSVKLLKEKRKKKKKGDTHEYTEITKESNNEMPVPDCSHSLSTSHILQELIIISSNF